MLRGVRSDRGDMQRDLLGPHREPGEAQPSGLRTELASVASGLAEGVRYLLPRRNPAAALGATGGSRLMYGALFLMSILLYRNYFYRSSVTTAEARFTVLVTVSAIGYGCAAVLAPAMSRRVTKSAGIVVMLAGSAVLTGALGETFNQVAYIVLAFFVNMAAR